METHPAHTALPVKAKSEAMDVLNWAWTGTPFFRGCLVDANLFLQDRLLPSQGSIPPPFTQEECQELMSLLRSFNNGKIVSDMGRRIFFTIYLQKMLTMTMASKPESFLESFSGLVSDLSYPFTFRNIY
jgi:hypothetical protein